MTEKKLKHVAVDMKNYEALSRLGGFHESFNDVIRRLLLDANQKEKKRTPQGAQVTSSAPSGSTGSLPNKETHPPTTTLVSVSQEEMPDVG
jgi:hypothetical protein